MSGNPDDPALRPLTSALADPALDRQAPRPHTGLIANDLKVAAVAAHRSGAAAGEGSAPTRLIDAPAQHWRHLLLFECIGAGAFGAVYRGFDPLVNREVAVKLLPKEAGGRSSLEEGRALARIRHPNVVVVYGADHDADQVGIWMEYLAGQTLADIVRDRGPMSAWEVSGVGIDLCHALSALHASGLLHRDIKAENVMREAGGRIVLMDFSSAEHVIPEAGITFSGTPGYMAPELFAGAPATVVSDVYSLGVLLFFLLSGRFPVAGTTIADIRSAHVARKHALLRDARPDVADRIVQVVERAIAYAPADRYQTTGEMERALASASGADAFLTPPPDSSPLAAWARRSWPLDGRSTALVIAALILTAAVIAGRTAMFSTPPLRSARVVFSLGPPCCRAAGRVSPLTGAWWCTEHWSMGGSSCGSAHSIRSPGAYSRTRPRQRRRSGRRRAAPSASSPTASCSRSTSTAVIPWCSSMRRIRVGATGARPARSSFREPAASTGSWRTAATVSR